MAAQVVVVADREGDIYPLFARKPGTVDFVIRASHDRQPASGGTLFAAPAGWQELGCAKVKIPPKRRRGEARLRHDATRVARPGSC